VESNRSKYLLPRVSIIIVNYNGLQWFKSFMSALVNTEYPDFEIVVVDNSSSDESVQYLKDNFKEVGVLELNENKGYAKAINIGARKATGDILAFINNDMEVRSDWLRKAVPKLTSNKAVAAVQCKVLSYNNREKIDCIGLSVDRYNLVLMIGRNEIDQGQYDNLEEISACSGGAMIIWKHLFLEAGCFDPTYFMYYEDIDLSWRIRLKGLQILPAQASIVYHVGSATSKIANSPGGGKLSPFFAFHTTKNYIYCWLKNSSLRTILIYWPVVLLIVLAKTLFGLLNGRSTIASAHIRGIFWNITHLRFISKERREIQKLRKARLNKFLPTNNLNCSSNLLAWIRIERQNYWRQI
jgi:GT2 family glycosyltransferase